MWFLKSNDPQETLTCVGAALYTPRIHSLKDTGNLETRATINVEAMQPSILQYNNAPSLSLTATTTTNSDDKDDDRGVTQRPSILLSAAWPKILSTKRCYRSACWVKSKANVILERKKSKCGLRWEQREWLLTSWRFLSRLICGNVRFASGFFSAKRERAHWGCSIWQNLKSKTKLRNLFGEPSPVVVAQNQFPPISVRFGKAFVIYFLVKLVSWWRQIEQPRRLQKFTKTHCRSKLFFPWKVTGIPKRVFTCGQVDLKTKLGKVQE